MRIRDVYGLTSREMAEVTEMTVCLELQNSQKTDPLVEFLRGLSGNALPVVKGNGRK